MEETGQEESERMAKKQDKKKYTLLKESDDLPGAQLQVQLVPVVGDLLSLSVNIRETQETSHHQQSVTR
jgi:hypothetical protein